MSRLWQTVLSIWAWVVLVTCVLVWFPLMAVLRLVTAPFDRGRYAVGYLFRQIPVVVAALNPLWRFRRARARCRPTPGARTSWCRTTSPSSTFC